MGTGGDMKIKKMVPYFSWVLIFLPSLRHMYLIPICREKLLAKADGSGSPLKCDSVGGGTPLMPREFAISVVEGGYTLHTDVVVRKIMHNLK